MTRREFFKAANIYFILNGDVLVVARNLNMSAFSWGQGDEGNDSCAKISRKRAFEHSDNQASDPSVNVVLLETKLSDIRAELALGRTTSTAGPSHQTPTVFTPRARIAMRAFSSLMESELLRLSTGYEERERILSSQFDAVNLGLWSFYI